MWRSQPTRNPKPGRRAVRLGLCAVLAVAPCAARSAAIGELLAKVEHGRPVLSWSYAWFSYCPSTRVCLAVAYNYPVLKPGANLPSELLIALSTIPTGAPGLATNPREDRGAPGDSLTLRIPLLDPQSSLRGP